MTDHGRTSRVIASLVASMTIGALVLMALDKQSLTAGPFSLASYTNLNPVEKIATESLISEAQHWDFVEIYYSGTMAGDIEQLAKFNGLSSSEDVNFHFLVCNGNRDGNIDSSMKWWKQRAALPGQDWFGDSQTIRICVVADGVRTLATDCQIQRTNDLVEELARDFNISKKSIAYPANWQL
ncbi:MAG: hypothetical protein KAJ07_06115 [Planctomycetes bacterium]|nr:hypothetical protein [Planctomycetota bacterium]